MTYSVYVKDKLFEKVKEVAQNLRLYCQNPDKDFTRNRKLHFEEMLRLIIMMEGGSIKKELLTYFDFDTNTVTSSAFIQQRSKIKTEAFEQIFHNFTDIFPGEKLYKEPSMTLDYYNKNAVNYSKETLSAEFYQQRKMLLKYLEQGAHILDLGCGAGRDSKAFMA